ncbi:right-handed parallel beta-helix repeat-containing protein [Candidatus Sumerlaeota bacterium]|nr:right-handed parallel beta-helix repeat-containing protein [Candidatus Sumerlaeota bacterium]
MLFAVVPVCALGALASAPKTTGTQARGEKSAVVDASKYPNLQAAFDAVPKGGGLVKLPPGEFEISRPLVLTRDDTRVEGAGAATHLINLNEKGEPALIIRPADRARDKRAYIWRVQLADFRISGNPKSGDGLLAEGVNEIYVHGLAIDHNDGHGISLNDCLEDARIADSIMTYNGGSGLNLVGCHDIVVSSNQFEENLDAVRCIDSFNLCMNGNNVDDHLRHGVVIENTYGSVVCGNMIEECSGTAVILDRDCYGITISANVIAHEGGSGVEIRDGWGCAVSANTFVLVNNWSVVIGPDSGRITVSANNFTNSHIGGKTKRPSEGAKAKMSADLAMGVLLDGTSDITVSGNVFSGMAEEAIKAQGDCKRIVITGNVVTDWSRSSPGKFPPLNLGRAGAIVENNKTE